MVGPIPPIPPPGAQVARTAAVVDPTAASAASSASRRRSPIDPARASIWTTGSRRPLPDPRRSPQRQAHRARASPPASPRRARSQVALEPGEVVAGVDIVLTAGTFIVGKVTDQHGAPVDRRAGLARSPRSARRVDGFTDADGEYKLGPVTGTVELHASAYGHVEVAPRARRSPPAKGATAGEQREDLVLEVADAVARRHASTTPPARRSAARTLDVIGGGGEGRHAIVARRRHVLDRHAAARPRCACASTHPDYPTDELDAVAVDGRRARAPARSPLGGAVEGALLDGSQRRAARRRRRSPRRARAARRAEATTDKTGRWKLGPLRAGRLEARGQAAGLPAARARARRPGRARAGRDVGARRPHRSRARRAASAARCATRAASASPARTSSSARSTAAATRRGRHRRAGRVPHPRLPDRRARSSATKGDARGATRATVRPATRSCAAIELAERSRRASAAMPLGST